MKETVGQAAQRALQDSNPDQTVVDTQREIDKEYMAEIEKCINGDAKEWNEPFYIVVLTKVERLLKNVVRRYFVARKSMPSPTYDQTVWRYDPKRGDLEFLWVLPDQETAACLALYPEDFGPEYSQLLGFVNAFLKDTLYISFYKKYEGKKDPERILKAM